MGFDVRRFDIYRKIPKDLTQPTFIGAIISIGSCSFIAFLLLVELSSFIATETKNEMFVDQAQPDDKLLVRLNVSLLQMQCEFIGLDIQDELGRYVLCIHFILIMNSIILWTATKLDLQRI
jgi:hypothetical protein